MSKRPLTAPHMGQPIDSAENSRSRRDWIIIDKHVFGRDRQVLVLPYNPTARLAMIRRTVSILWPRAKGKARERREAQVMIILGTALTPSR